MAAKHVISLLLFVTSLCNPFSVLAEYVVEVPVLAAIRSNGQGVFEIMILKWDQRPEPDPIELIRYHSRVRLGSASMEAIDRAFGYAIERSSSVRHSGTVSVFGHAYRPAHSDGPSAGAAMAVGFIAMFNGHSLLRGIALTGTLEPGGRIGPVGSIPDKMRAAAREGYRIILVPAGQIYGSGWNLTQVALDLNMVVKEVTTVDEAYELMTGRRV